MLDIAKKRHRKIVAKLRLSNLDEKNARIRIYSSVEPRALDIEHIRFRRFSDFVKKGEGICGSELRELAVALHGNLGIYDREEFLEKQDRIPSEIRRYIIVFPGTFLQESIYGMFGESGGFLFPILFFDGNSWIPENCDIDGEEEKEEEWKKSSRACLACIR